MFDFSYHTCPICKKGYFGTHHSCGTKWHCIKLDYYYERAKDDLDQWEAVYDDDAKTAAEWFVQRNDSFMAEFSEMTIVVVRDENGSLQYFEVEGRLEPQYNASTMTAEQAQVRLEQM